MLKPIEQRVEDLETICTDMPELLNLRLERIDLAQRQNASRFDEIAGRRNLLGRQMGAPTHGVRDLRGAIARQLLAQDAEIAGIKSSLCGLHAGMARQDTEAVIAPLKELAEKHPRFGYRRIHVYHERDGFVMNAIRMHRLWRQAKLQPAKGGHHRRRKPARAQCSLCGSLAGSVQVEPSADYFLQAPDRDRRERAQAGPPPPAHANSSSTPVRSSPEMSPGPIPHLKLYGCYGASQYFIPTSR